jgi:alpha-tubulin suppressor-like RCC1 family protein
VAGLLLPTVGCGPVDHEKRALQAPHPRVQGSRLSGGIHLTGGSFHSLGLSEDRLMQSWGNGGLGQLGDGTMVHSKTIPGWVLGPGNIVSVVANSSQSLALDVNGTVWAWGYNGYGQLGDGTTQSRTTPVKVPGLSSVVSIAAGHEHSLALTADGTVWAWGRNNLGQLGDGSTLDHRTPAQVPGLNGVIAIAAGFYHSLALTADGSVWAWGNNAWGALGDGTDRPRYSPVQVLGLNTIVAVAAAESQSLALDADRRGGCGPGAPTTTASWATDRRLAAAWCQSRSLA